MSINGELPGFKLFGKTIVWSDQKDNINQEDDHVLIEESSSRTSTSTSTSTSTAETSAIIKSKTRAPAPQQLLLSCPRCKSKETKFCYYNNYNVNQPRHFCKACHRYWTAGGLLRNVPVGAGRRRNRALLPSSTSTQEPAAGSGGADEEEEACGSVLVGRDWRGGGSGSGHDPAKSTFGNVDACLIS